MVNGSKVDSARARCRAERFSNSFWGLDPMLEFRANSKKRSVRGRSALHERAFLSLMPCPWLCRIIQFFCAWTSVGIPGSYAVQPRTRGKMFFPFVHRMHELTVMPDSKSVPNNPQVVCILLYKIFAKFCNYNDDEDCSRCC